MENTPKITKSYYKITSISFNKDIYINSRNSIIEYNITDLCGKNIRIIQKNIH